MRGSVAAIQHTPNYAALTGVAADSFRKAQIRLLEQIAEDKPREIPAGYVPFLKADTFTAEYEAMVRVLTNPDGQHNSAYDPELFAKMPVQNQLTKMWGWFHGTTGFSVMFRWASGRQDAYVVLDNPNASDEAKEAQAKQIASFKAATDNFLKEMQHAN